MVYLVTHIQQYFSKVCVCTYSINSFMYNDITNNFERNKVRFSTYPRPPVSMLNNLYANVFNNYNRLCRQNNIISCLWKSPSTIFYSLPLFIYLYVCPSLPSDDPVNNTIDIIMLLNISIKNIPVTV